MPDSLSTKCNNQHTVHCFITAKCGNKITEGKKASFFKKKSIVLNFNFIHFEF